MKYQRLKDLREDLDLTQEKLSNYLHISQRSYSHFENGTRGIPVEILSVLADYYDTSIDYLTERTDTKTPYPKSKKQRSP